LAAEHLAKMCGDKQEEISTEQTNITGGPRGGSVAPQAILLVRPDELIALNAATPST
jgi:hypothetical protein